MQSSLIHEFCEIPESHSPEARKEGFIAIVLELVFCGSRQFLKKQENIHRAHPTITSMIHMYNFLM